MNLSRFVPPNTFLLGALTKLRKATVSFATSMSAHLFLCLSVRIEQLGFHWTGFHEI